MTGLGFAPPAGWAVVAAVAILALAAARWARRAGLRGWALRGLAGLVAAGALAGPMLSSGIRTPLSDIVILLDDRSASQSLPGRAAQTDRALDRLAGDIAATPGTELRRLTVGDDPEGTLLAEALARAIAAEPASRLAGVIVLSDGLAHDGAALPATAPAPVHVLLTGQPADWDRRLVVEQAPAYGLIGQPVTLRLRVEDEGAVPPAIARSPARLRLSLDGEPGPEIILPPGQSVDLPVVPRHAGQNLVLLGLAPLPGGSPAQLTAANDSAVVAIQGVRDRLRVLLVSGEPHAGERAWRNLLKSDPNVDLIHFTILRPPDKADGVPVDEMALIAFPTHELFMQRIRDFDLIIFDRYRVRGILRPEYFDSIRRYVEEGGAVLVSAGPEMAGVESLNLTALGAILPAQPTGRVHDGAFLPRLTDQGARHPVTAGLPGDPAGDPARPWGRWLRMAQASARAGAQVVMAGQAGDPLLVLGRVGKGRVAMLTSDQVWLWGRGFEGGGPQQELLRRIAHWAMQEPELDEEALLAEPDPDRATDPGAAPATRDAPAATPGLGLRITRRTMADEVPPLVISGPDPGPAGPQGDQPPGPGDGPGEGAAPAGPRSWQITLDEAGPGRFVTRWRAPAPGLYRLTNGALTRLVALGPANPREMAQTVASERVLAPLAAATGGAVLHLSDGIPDLRSQRPGRVAHGRGGSGAGWIGVTPRGAASVSGVASRPLLPGWAWPLLIAALALAAWLREGRGRPARTGDGR